MESGTKSFGVRLRGLIEKKGETVAQFSERYGIGESQAFNWLKLQKPPPAKHWQRISDYFGVSESYVITGTPDVPFALIREPEDYRVSGSEQDRELGAPTDKKQAMINPRHAAAPQQPNRSDIEEHVRKYLDLAEKIPGGITLAYYEIKEAIPLKKMQSRQEDVAP